jgi:hypothetical protein
MKILPTIAITIAAASSLVLLADEKSQDKNALVATEGAQLKKAFIDGTGEGWSPLGGEDFVNVNCKPDTWTWKDGVAYCTGKPVGVIRMKEPIKNFEMVCEWKHKQDGGNSGVFVWASQKSITSHGDVFPTGPAKMKPFPPIAPNGKRSFPSKNLTKGLNEWNHYYIRAINGEVRLWVNGEEVSGGTECSPAEGYLCLESEGAPVEFKNLRIRLLP